MLVNVYWQYNGLTSGALSTTSVPILNTYNSSTGILSTNIGVYSSGDWGGRCGYIVFDIICVYPAIYPI